MFLVQKSLQNEWSYIQRVVANVEKPFSLLKAIIVNDFLPSLFGNDLDNMEASIIMMSTHNGGLGIRDPVSIATAETSFQSSHEGTLILSQAITLGGPFNMDKYEMQMKAVKMPLMLSTTKSKWLKPTV